MTTLREMYNDAGDRGKQGLGETMSNLQGYIRGMHGKDSGRKS